MSPVVPNSHGRLDKLAVQYFFIQLADQIEQKIPTRNKGIHKRVVVPEKTRQEKSQQVFEI